MHLLGGRPNGPPPGDDGRGHGTGFPGFGNNNQQSTSQQQGGSAASVTTGSAGADGVVCVWWLYEA